MSGKEGMFPAPIPTAKLRNYYKSPNHMRPNPLQMPCGAVLVNFDESPPVAVVRIGRCATGGGPAMNQDYFGRDFRIWGRRYSGFVEVMAGERLERLPLLT